MSEETHEILTRKEVIAVDQDPLGIQGFGSRSKNGLEVWFKPLQNDAWAMCCLNRSPRPQAITFDWSAEVVADDISGRQAMFHTNTYRSQNLWTGAHGTTSDPLGGEIAGHDVLMLRLERE